MMNESKQKMETASHQAHEQGKLSIELRDSIATVEAEIAIMETEVRTIVANAVDAVGKPVYSNEEKRKAAVASMLQESQAYISLVARLKVLKGNLDMAYCRMNLELRTFEGHRAFLYALSAVRGV